MDLVFGPNSVPPYSRVGQKAIPGGILHCPTIPPFFCSLVPPSPCVNCRGYGVGQKAIPGIGLVFWYFGGTE